ncbi:MAG: hypothetical protein ABSG35_20415 [Syntrophobacteraceae bacterium]
MFGPHEKMAHNGYHLAARRRINYIRLRNERILGASDSRRRCLHFLPYTHGAILVAMAFAALGDGASTLELLSMINPVNHA